MKEQIIIYDPRNQEQHRRIIEIYQGMQSFNMPFAIVKTDDDYIPKFKYITYYRTAGFERGLPVFTFKENLI